MSHVAVSTAVTSTTGGAVGSGKSTGNAPAGAGSFGALFASIVQGNMQAFGRSISTSPLPTLFNVEAGSASFAEGTPLQPLTPFQNDIVADELPGLMARVEQVLADKPELLEQVKSTLASLTQTQEGLAVLANPEALAKVLEVQGVPHDVAETLSQRMQFADWEEILATAEPLPKKSQNLTLEKLEKVESVQAEKGLEENEPEHVCEPVRKKIPYAAPKADPAEQVLRDLPLTPLPVPVALNSADAEPFSPLAQPVGDEGKVLINADNTALPFTPIGEAIKAQQTMEASSVTRGLANTFTASTAQTGASPLTHTLQHDILADTTAQHGESVVEVAKTLKSVATEHTTMHTAHEGAALRRESVAPVAQSSAPVVGEATKFNPKNNRIVKEGEHIAAPKGDVVYTLTAKDIVLAPAANNFVQPTAQTPMADTSTVLYNPDTITESEGDEFVQAEQDMAGVSATSTERRAGTAATAQPFATSRNPIHQQIQVQVQQLAQQGGGNVKLQLNPEHLGEVTIELDIKNGHVQGTIAASNPEVVEQLARELHILKQGFAEAGLQLTDQGVDIMWQQPESVQDDNATVAGNSHDNGWNATDDNSVNLAGRWIAPEQIIDVEV